MLILVIIIILILVFVLIVKPRRLPLDSVVMVNGAVGKGKTSTAVSLAIKSHKKNLRRYKLRKFLHLKVESTAPCLYSNIPLFRIDYVPLTTDMILRKVRFAPKSIVLISESSLIANSMSYKDKEVNDKLTLFVKLIRHEMHGTYVKCPNMIIETQSIKDNHFAFDRCITQSLYIHRVINLPFVRLVKARVLMLVDSDSVVNIYNKDDDDEHTYLVWKSVFKKYDSYAYRILTDNLTIKNNVKHFNINPHELFEIATLLKNEEIIKNNERVLENEREKESN